jgi:hypothetical protein
MMRISCSKIWTPIKNDRQLQLPDQTRSATSTHSAVHLDEGKLFVQLGENGGGDGARWILDSGATNHMTGVRAVFSEIDLRVHGTVRFGDGSVINIVGRDTILIKCKTGGLKALTGVYYIPRLKANIISLVQMEEAGYKIVLESGFLKLWNHAGNSDRQGEAWCKSLVCAPSRRGPAGVSGGAGDEPGLALAFKVRPFEFPQTQTVV